MPVTVEFFGVPRRRTGVSSVELSATRLDELLGQLGGRFPELAAHCLDGERLRSGYMVNVNGERFTTDPATPLVDGDHVLLLSADAGG